MALSGTVLRPHTFEVPTKIVLNLLAIDGIAFAGGQAHAIINVSAVVRPAARIDVLSATTANVFATMPPNVEGWVWAAAGSCSSSENPKVIATSGLHLVSFSPDEVQSKNLVCFASSDGLLHTSARLR